MRTLGERQWETCSKCGVIGDSLESLDARSICYRCLDDARFGKQRARCKKRGYHTVSFAEIDHCGRVYVKCDCDRVARTLLVLPEHPVEGWFDPDTVGFKRWVISPDGDAVAMTAGRQ